MCTRFAGRIEHFPVFSLLVDWGKKNCRGEVCLIVFEGIEQLMMLKDEERRSIEMLLPLHILSMMLGADGVVDFEVGTGTVIEGLDTNHVVGTTLERHRASPLCMPLRFGRTDHHEPASLPAKQPGPSPRSVWGVLQRRCGFVAGFHSCQHRTQLV